MCDSSLYQKDKKKRRRKCGCCDCVIVNNNYYFIGPSGPVGPTGPQGIQGIQGNDGPVGPIGPQGIQGIQGIQGNDGPVGPIGPQGIQGVQGIQGNDGPVGPIGSQGIQGIQGVQGIQGIQGIQGQVGPIGPIGPVGPSGSGGISPNVVTAINNLQGGAIIPSMTSGNYGLNITPSTLINTNPANPWSFGFISNGIIINKTGTYKIVGRVQFFDVSSPGVIPQVYILFSDSTNAGAGFIISQSVVTSSFQNGTAFSLMTEFTVSLIINHTLKFWAAAWTGTVEMINLVSNYFQITTYQATVDIQQLF